MRRLNVDMVLERGSGEAASIVATPSITTRLGQPASIEIGAEDSRPRRRIAVVVTPNAATLRPLGAALRR